MRAIGLCVSIALVASPALAADAQGFAEVRLAYTPGVSGKAWQVVERLRPTFAAELSERLALAATLETSLVQGRNLGDEIFRTLRASDFAPYLVAAGYTGPTHRNRRLHVDDADDYLDVDRLYLDFYGAALDVRVGRQALQWGSARFFNPTDPFPEVLLAEPWRPRRGVNAVRVTVPWGELSEVAAVAAVDDALQAGRAALRLMTNWAETDLAVVGVYRGDNRTGLVGLDLRGTLGVGWWLEGAWHLGGQSYEEVSVGVDYSFPVLDRLVVLAQYYRNGAGQTDPDAYARTGGLALAGVSGPDDLVGSGTRDPFAPVTAARDYLLVGAVLAASPELSLSFNAMQNLDDGTAMLIPTVTATPLGWLELAVSAQVPVRTWGAGGELSPRRRDLLVQQAVPGVGTLQADLSGLVPTATVTLWTRGSF